MLHQKNEPQKNPPPSTWTEDDSIAFECARETIGNLIAILFGQVYREKAKEHPDQKLLKNLKEKITELHEERTNMKNKNELMDMGAWSCLKSTPMHVLAY